MKSFTTASGDWQNLVSDFLLQNPRNPLIVIIGPTGSGKTRFSISLALWLQEKGLLSAVVNADSRQFYTYLDIGTAKITEEEMKGVPHHLLSVLDPSEDCSISWFREQATHVIEKLHREQKIPLLVGGSMLYVSALVDGLQPIASDAGLREMLSQEYDRDEGVSLHAELAAVDPVSAAAIPRENRVYVLRAMEIFRTTGKPKSEVLQRTETPYDLLLLGMAIDRDDLRVRLAKRTKAMFAVGWVAEVQSLLDKGYTEKDPGMASHGYREIFKALKEGTDPSTLQELIVTKAMQYAKRHQTWWKSDPRVHWIQAI